jgi:hypothetical protein
MVTADGATHVVERTLGYSYQPGKLATLALRPG